MPEAGRVTAKELSELISREVATVTKLKDGLPHLRTEGAFSVGDRPGDRIQGRVPDRVFKHAVPWLRTYGVSPAVYGVSRSRPYGVPVRTYGVPGVVYGVPHLRLAANVMQSRCRITAPHQPVSRPPATVVGRKEPSLDKPLEHPPDLDRVLGRHDL